MPVYNWSQTAASNATADATINWAEGQAPSSLNDSARAMMAAVAKWRDDNSGTLNTTGTSTAYVLATNSIFDSLAHMDGQTIMIAPHVTCGDNPTLNVDGLGAQTILHADHSAVLTGDIQHFGLYSLTFFNGGGWFLRSSAQKSFDAGTLMLFQQTTAPTGWTKQTTHNDKTLRVVSGTASSGGSSAFSTVFGKSATDSYTLLTADIPSHNHGVTDPGHVHGVHGVNGGSIGNSTINFLRASTDSSSGDNNSASQTTGISIQNIGGGGGHTHAMDIRVQFVDLIIASKA